MNVIVPAMRAHLGAPAGIEGISLCLVGECGFSSLYF